MTLKQRLVVGISSGLVALSFAATAAFGYVVYTPIVTSEISNGAITTAKIADLAVTTAKLAGSAVTAAKLASNAVTSVKIDNGTITAADLAADSVGSSEIAANAVGASEIAASAVNTSEIDDGAVTSDKILDATILNEDIDFDTIQADSLATGSVESDEILDGTIVGDDLAADLQIESEVTRATSATGSFQNLAGDLIYGGAAGGTSWFHAGVMGHFHGDDLSNSAVAYHAGVIGGYSVLTADDITGPKAGVVGFIGADGPSTVGDAAVMAVLEGDGGVNTANAAYGVQYLNSTPGSVFSYGLDLSHAAVGAYAAVTYGTADIRLAAGTTISSGDANPANCVKGSIFLNTASGLLNGCTSTDTWEAYALETP